MMGARLAGLRSLCLLPLLLAPSITGAERLPTAVTPVHYDLTFDVDLAGARFAGDETIQVRLAEPSRRIVLHALDIQFHEVAITAGGSTQKAAVSLDASDQTATLEVPRQIPAGPADIRIRYAGILNDKLRGFYLSKSNGRNYAVTQLQATDARRAFPSFDEPALKATFSIILIVDRDDTAISNGRLISDVPGPGSNRHTLKFSTTPKMSSYLVAMAVGDFVCDEGSSEGVPVRVCSTPDKKGLSSVALDAAQRILAFCNRYYSIKYPFGKLDIVAVPDFAAGAMENTAAIFYREVDLLADSRAASVASMKRIWTVLAHEIAHQWFGDLVTMRWWDDLWLNEGFATWMEKRPLAALKPDWKTDVDEAADTQAAMNLDSLTSTRAIHSNVETPDEIEGSFDAIAYEKGAAVMRMIEGYVGADGFRQGVNAYLEKHAYGNATSEDFWRTMTAVSGKPVDRILPTFVNQPGVPIVTFTDSCEGNRQSASLRQQRFLLDPGQARSPHDATWSIPVCTTTGDAAASPSCSMLASRSVTGLTLSPRCTPWTFINAGARGYYRSQYTPSMLRALAPDVAKLTASERLSLIGDEWALVRAGRHTIANYLTLASGFREERTNGVLSELTARLEFVGDYLTSDRTRTAYERFVRDLLSRLATELGLNASLTDDDDRRALRATVIEALGRTGNDPEISAKARTALEASLSGRAPLDSTAANAMVRVSAARGDAALWDRLLSAAQQAASPAEHYRYLYALPAFEDPALIDGGLRFALTSELRSQDTPAFLSRYLANPAARGLAWTFVKEHWTELAPKITISLGDVRLVQALGSFCDTQSRDDIRSFFDRHRLPAARRALDQTLERINNCVEVRENQKAALESWLATQ